MIFNNSKVGNKNNQPIMMLCYVLAIFMAISIDLYLPLLPSIANTFTTSTKSAQFTLNIFLFGFAFSQIFYGVIADNFGKRKSLLIGLILYCISSLGCMFSISIQMLDFFRLIQSFGACSASVSAYALARDSYDGVDLTRVLANMAIIMTIIPSIAPYIGGVIGGLIGWRYSFILLAGMSAFTIFLVCLFLQDASESIHREFSFKKILLDYMEVAANKIYICNVLIGTSAFLAFYIFILASPFIFIKILSMSFSQYGILMAINAIVLATGNHFSKFIDAKFGSTVCVIIGSIFMAIGSIVMLLPFMHSFLYLFPMLICSIGIGIISPSSISAALRSQKNKSVQASALAGFIRFSFPMLISVFIGVSFEMTALVILLCAVYNLFLIWLMTFTLKNEKLNYEN